MAQATPRQLMTTIQECCAKGPGFFSPRMPVLEAVFRLLLARGNQPASAEEIARQLSPLRGEQLHPATVEQLLLGAEPHFYGLRHQAEEGV